MSKLIYFLFLIVCLTACTCDDMEFVIGELPDLFLVEATTDGELIIIRFNHPVEQASLQGSSSLLIEGDSINYSGQFTFVNDSTITISLCDLQCSQQQCTAQLRLKSEADGTGVSSQTGQLLDGDRDGLSGGDFIQNILVPGCQMLELPPIILNPAANQLNSLAYQITPEKQFSFSVTFSAPMDTSTVINDSTIVLYIPDSDQNLTGTLSWTSDSSFTFISTPLPDYCSMPNDYHIQLIIKGTSNGGIPAIYGASGLALDGDKDGQPGGEFTTQFLIPSPISGIPFVTNSILGMYDPPHIIEFSEPMDTASCIPGVSLSLMASCSVQSDPVLDNFLVLSWSNNNQTLTIYHDYVCPAPPPGSDLITLIGGCNALKSECGVPFDGDGDGEPGGVFTIELPEDCMELVQPLSLSGYLNADCVSDYPYLERNDADNGFNFTIEIGPDEIDPSSVYLGAGGIRFFLIQDMVMTEVSGHLQVLGAFEVLFESDVINNFCMGMGDCCVIVEIGDNMVGANCQMPIDANLDFTSGGQFMGSFLVPQ